MVVIISYEFRLILLEKDKHNEIVLEITV